MKRLKDPYTPLIAMSMILVAVVALLFFTEPLPSSEELEPVLGNWVSVIPDDPTDSSYNGKAFTLREDSICDFNALGKRCRYRYDATTQTVTVELPENKTQGLTYKLTDFYGFKALQLGERYYVREADHPQALELYQWNLDFQPPEIIQRTEADLEPILGPWLNWSITNPFYTWDFTFDKDMTCRFNTFGGEYPYNYDPDTKTVTVYASPQKSKAVVYTLTEQSGITMLHRSDTGDFYTEEQDYQAAHKLYVQQTQSELYRKHQATREILLEGKASIAEMLPYHQEGCLDIYKMYGDHSVFGVYMTTPASKSLRVMEALQDVRLVTTSVNDNWTQAELEDHYSVPVSSIAFFDGSLATPESVVYTEEIHDPNDLFFWSEDLRYFFDLTQSGDGEGICWKIEDLGYQDLFVFFKIYGEEETFYFQLDN